MHVPMQCFFGRHDTQQNDTKNNDTEPNNIVIIL